MGVDRSDYLMWGVDVGPNAFDWDKHEAEMEGRTGAKFSIIYDGMSGMYCIAGKMLASSDEYEGFGMVKITPDVLDFDKKSVVDAVIEKFPNLGIDEDDFSLMLFTHFS